MKITISPQNQEGDHTITINGVEIPPHDQLALPSETLVAIKDHILENHLSSEYEDLYISIGDELLFRVVPFFC